MKNSISRFCLTTERAENVGTMSCLPSVSCAELHTTDDPSTLLQQGQFSRFLVFPTAQEVLKLANSALLNRNNYPIISSLELHTHLP